MKTQILNSKGEHVTLNRFEAARATALQNQFDRELKNALGFKLDITTLTGILKSVTEQKFYQLPLTDYVPLPVGEGAWSEEIVKYRSFSTGDDFKTGILNTGENGTRLAEVDAGFDAVKNPVLNWGKQINWNIMQLQIAARNGTIIDYVTSLETSRKKNWDLGLQETLFWGQTDVTGVNGILTQSDVTANTSIITKKISAMNASELQAFLGTIYETYRSNCQGTAEPTHFLIPEDDFNGLGRTANEEYNNKTLYQRILETFVMLTGNPNFKVLKNRYAMKSVNANVTGLNKNRYVLYNYDADSLRMDIPVDYTSTMQNSINGFTFSNVAYGQFTGVKSYRPREMIYFDY